MSNDKLKAERVARLQEYREKVKKGEVSAPIIRNHKEKWEENKSSLRLSVNAMCFDCFGGEVGDNVREEIKNCSARSCPLWNVRPHKK